MRQGNTTAFPRNWAATTVGEICHVIGGGTPSTERADFWTSGTPWVTSADLFGITDVRPRRQVTDEAIRASATNRVPAGSVIVATRVGLGKVGLAPTDMCFSQDCHGLVFHDVFISRLFLTYFLQVAVQEFKHVSRGTTIAGVTKKQLIELPVWLPPFPEQRRIVAEIEKHFTRLDAAVASLQRARANLKRYRASVLKAACEGRLLPTEAELARREGRAYEPASVLLERILKERHARWEGQNGRRGTYREPQAADSSNLPPLPEGWAWVRLDSVATQVADVDHKMPAAVINGLPYVSPKDFFAENGIDFDGAKLISHQDFERLSRKVQPEAGDVLLSRYGTVGQVRHVKDSIQFQASYSIAIIKPVRLAPLSEFIALVLRSDLAQAQMQQNIRASHQPDLGLESIKQFAIPLPPLAEQPRIVAEVERHLSVIEAAENVVGANLKRAERLRQAILQRAFQGELVSQNPTDEPASVLLERIRAERQSVGAQFIAPKGAGVINHAPTGTRRRRVV